MRCPEPGLLAPHCHIAGGGIVDIDVGVIYSLARSVIG